MLGLHDAAPLLVDGGRVGRGAEAVGATVGVSERVIVTTGGVNVVAGGRITGKVGPPGLSEVTVTTGTVGCAAIGLQVTVGVYLVPVSV